MAKTFLKKTRESVGVIPAMGLKCVVEEIEKGETGPNAATPGCLMYTVSLRVTEPARFKGASLRDWFTIGTKDDKRAKREETWERDGGPGRLVRLLKRANVAIVDDDEEWMEAAENAEVCITVTKRADNSGELRNRVANYFREEDDDFVGVGEELEAEEPKAKAGAGGSVRDKIKAKAKKVADDDEEDDEDEAPKSARKPKGKAKKVEDDDDDEADDEGDDDADDEEEAPKTRKAAAKRKAARKPADDEDDDEE